MFAQVVQPIQMHLATLVPALLLGVVGGLLASLFTRLNTFICKRRTMLLAKIPSRLLRRLVGILETILLVVGSLIGNSFYRAMHFSAKRGIAIACRLSVCLSVCNVGEL